MMKKSEMTDKMATIDIRQRVEILLDGLPYMRKYAGRTIVIKYGGNAMVNEELKTSVMRDLYLLQTIGMKIVLVHGGGPAIDQAMSRLNKPTKFIDGLRYTDGDDIQIINAVLSGQVNKSLVADLHKIGARAIGLSGADGHLIQTKQLSTELGYVGKIVKIDAEAIKLLLNANYIPVIASIGIDDRGQLYNVNADTAASEIAAALNAEQFILMTDVRGIFRDIKDPDSLYHELSVDQVQQMLGSGALKGGMIPKIRAIIAAINNGLKEAVVLDGRVEHSILLELFSTEGYGSLITQ